MFLLVLLFLSGEGIVLSSQFSNYLKPWLNLLLYVGIPLVTIVVGVWQYRAYLVKREREFPRNSAWVLDEESKDEAIGEQK